MKQEELTRRQSLETRKAMARHDANMAKAKEQRDREQSAIEGQQIEGTARHMHDNMDKADRRELDYQLYQYGRYGQAGRS